MMPGKGLESILELKTGPNLIGQHQQKIWLRVQRKNAQQSPRGSQPAKCLDKALARHVRLLRIVGSGRGAESALHVLAG